MCLGMVTVRPVSEKSSVIDGLIGGHLAFRCAFDKRVAAAVCYFATDIHSHSLGEGKRDDSLGRAGDIRGEIIMVSLLPKTAILAPLASTTLAPIRRMSCLVNGC